MSNVKYCPVCGFVACFGQWDTCIECNADLIDTGKTLNMYYTELDVKSPEIVQDYIRNKYIYNVSDFNIEKENERLKNVDELKNHIKEMQNISNDNQIYCPHCGSTNIQLIPKKWSLLTGFLTNRVDRYCVNCKRKF